MERNELREEIWFAHAELASRLATCPRAHIGACLVKFDRIIGMGRNGAPEGRPHCPDDAEHLALAHCLVAIHAERNALRNAFMNPYGSTMYVVGPRPLCYGCIRDAKTAGVFEIRHRRTIDGETTIIILSSTVEAPAEETELCQ